MPTNLIIEKWGGISTAPQPVEKSYLVWENNLFIRLIRHTFPKFMGF